MAIALLTAVLVIFTTLFLKATYDTISWYFLTPKRIKKIMEKQGVYGPTPCPLTGNLMEMSAMVSQSTAEDMDHIHHNIVGRVLPHYVSWSKQYGKPFVYWHGTEPRLCLTEIEKIMEFLTNYNRVTGRSWLQREGSKHFMGKGILMANGEDWYHQRRLAAPAFNGDKLKSLFAGKMLECTKHMIRSLENAVESGQPDVEIGDIMTRVTGDIISRIGFGCDFEKADTIFHCLTLLQGLSAKASLHLCYPGSRFLPSKYNREIQSVKNEINGLLMGLIQSRKDSVEIGRSNSYGNDFLGNILDEMEMEKKRSNGLNFNLNLVIDLCKSLFFGGHETTSVMLTWTMMLLATNPNWQEKVRTEVRQVFNGGTPSVDNLSKLTTLTMVINESLRLYPSGMVLPRMAFEDIKLGDLLIPKGLSVWVPVVAINHSEELWGKDANEFNPDRFAARTSAVGRQFFPFAAGPRNCLGQAFGMMESKIILSMLISKFSFTISDNYRHAPIVVLTIQPKHGVLINLKPLPSSN